MKEVIMDIPHGGTLIPEEAKPHLHEDLTVESLLAESDAFSDELYFKQHGVPLSNKAYFEYFRTVVDVNRRFNDFTRDGVIKTHTHSYDQIYKNPRGLPNGLALSLVEKYAAPYRENLIKIAAQPQAKLIVLGHTMDPVGNSGSVNPGEKRPLFTIANGGDKEGNARTDYQAPRDVMEFIRDEITARLPELNLDGVIYNGNAVTFNNPFGGVLSIGRLGKKALQNKKAVMFEVNKSLICQKINGGAPTARPGNISTIREALGDIYEGILSRITK